MAETHVHAYELELEDAERELQAAQARVEGAKASLKAKQAELNPAPVVEEPVEDKPKQSRVNKPAPKTVKEAAASTTPTPLSRPKTRGSSQREPFSAT